MSRDLNERRFLICEKEKLDTLEKIKLSFGLKKTISLPSSNDDINRSALSATLTLCVKTRREK
jgi:hypothetical protein